MLRSAPTAVISVDPILQMSLAQACSFRRHSLVPAPVKVAGLGPLWHRSLDYSCSGGVDYIRLVPIDVPGSCLFLRRSLA